MPDKVLTREIAHRVWLAGDKVPPTPVETIRDEVQEHEKVLISPSMVSRLRRAGRWFDETKFKNGEIVGRLKSNYNADAISEWREWHTEFRKQHRKPPPTDPTTRSSIVADRHAKGVLKAAEWIELALETASMNWEPGQYDLSGVKLGDVEWPVPHELAEQTFSQETDHWLAALGEHFPELITLVRSWWDNARAWEKVESNNPYWHHFRRYWHESNAELNARLVKIRLRGKLPEGSWCHLCSEEPD